MRCWFVTYPVGHMQPLIASSRLREGAEDWQEKVAKRWLPVSRSPPRARRSAEHSAHTGTDRASGGSCSVPADYGDESGAQRDTHTRDTITGVSALRPSFLSSTRTGN